MVEILTPGSAALLQRSAKARRWTARGVRTLLPHDIVGTVECMFDHARALLLIDQHECPCCHAGPMSDPARSPYGWCHCPRCRCAWRTAKMDGRRYSIVVPGVSCSRWDRPVEVERRRDRAGLPH